MSADKSVAFTGGSPPSAKTQVSPPVVVSCSVCLEAVTDAGDRSIAKLKCGHHFHLDCIGSAFNAKGRMQCPNCRHVEHGQWLYGNGCFMHEDFVDDLTYEDDAEVYGGATNFQFGHTPWCPHQGSFAHFSLTFEEMDNIGNRYLDPMVNWRRGSRASSARHICPYLAAQGFSIGGPLHHVEDFLGLQVRHHSTRTTRTPASFSSAQRSHWQRQGSAASASTSIPSSYEGSSQNYSSSGRFVQPSASRRAFGLFLGNQQAVHAGVNQGTNYGGNPGHLFGQASHSRNAQAMNGNTNYHLPNGAWNGYSGSRRTRSSDMASIPSQRASQISPSEQVWMNELEHEYSPWGAQSALGQGPHQLRGGDPMGWSADNQFDSWTRATYAPQAQFGTSNHWWAWIPHGNNPGQRAIPNTIPNSYHDDQFFGAGLFPRPASQGMTENVSEGAYAWVSSGFR